MNRKGFLAELKNLLVFMDVNDRTRVLERYETIFDEAGEEGEATLLRTLGSPVRQVLQIEQEYREAVSKGETPFAAADSMAFLPKVEKPAETAPEPAAVPAPAEPEKKAEPEIKAEPESEPEPERKPEPEPAPELKLEPETEPEPEPAPEPEPEQTAPEERAPQTREDTQTAGLLTPSAEEEKEAEAVAAILQPEPEPAPEASPEEAEAGSAPAASPAEVTESAKTQSDDPAPKLPDKSFMNQMASQPEISVADTAMPWETPAPPERESRRPERSGQLSSNKSEGASRRKTRGYAPSKKEEYKPGGGRILAAVLVTIPMLILWAVCIGVSLALGVTVLAMGLCFGAASMYLASYVFSGVITFAPDLMLVAGGALFTAAVTLLLIWTGLWIAIGGIILMCRMTGSIYRAVLGKGKEE